MQLFADRSRKLGNSLGTNNEHMQRRCAVGGAKKTSFLADVCLSACARRLVHVGCSV